MKDVEPESFGVFRSQNPELDALAGVDFDPQCVDSRLGSRTGRSHLDVPVREVRQEFPGWGRPNVESRFPVVRDHLGMVKECQFYGCGETRSTVPTVEREYRRRGIGVRSGEEVRFDRPATPLTDAVERRSELGTHLSVGGLQRLERVPVLDVGRS